jgi:DNA-binding ferritin-like protein
MTKTKTRKGYRRRKSLKRKISRTVSSKKIDNTKSHLVKIFLEMINMVKLYHWKTHSFSQHKATDELYTRLSDNIDRFLEVLMGKDQSRVHMLETKIELLDPDSVKEFKTRIHQYRDFLENINIYFDKRSDSDLLSIRDDILADLNQFLYLMSMS